MSSSVFKWTVTRNVLLNRQTEYCLRGPVRSSSPKSSPAVIGENASQVCAEHSDMALIDKIFRPWQTMEKLGIRPTGRPPHIQLASEGIMKVLLAAVGLMFSQLVWADAYDDGVAAYHREDYATAIVKFKEAAAQGNVLAKNNVGVMYEYGLGVPGDEKEAAKWYKQAADQRDTTAKVNSGGIFSLVRDLLADNTKTAFNGQKIKSDATSFMGETLGQPVSNNGELFYDLDKGCQLKVNNGAVADCTLDNKTVYKIWVDCNELRTEVSIDDMACGRILSIDTQIEYQKLCNEARSTDGFYLRKNNAYYWINNDNTVDGLALIDQPWYLRGEGEDAYTEAKCPTNTLVAGTINPAHRNTVDCQGLKYGSASYHENMDLLAKLANLKDGYWSRYTESFVSSLCDGDIKSAHGEVQRGNVEPNDAANIAKVLDISYQVSEDLNLIAPVFDRSGYWVQEDSFLNLPDRGPSCMNMLGWVGDDGGWRAMIIYLQIQPDEISFYLRYLESFITDQRTAPYKTPKMLGIV